MAKHVEKHLEQERKDLEVLVTELRAYLRFPQGLKRLEIAALESLLQGSEALTQLCTRAARGERDAAVKLAVVLGGSVMLVGLLVRKLFK